MCDSHTETHRHVVRAPKTHRRDPHVETHMVHAHTQTHMVHAHTQTHMVHAHTQTHMLKDPAVTLPV